MSFTVTRSGSDTTSAIDFSYTLGGGTATGGGVDYVSTGGSGSIATGGAGTTTINVPIVGDTLYEGNETFQVTVTVTSGNANSPVGPATGTITDNETKPTLTVGAGSLTEGDIGTANMSFTVTRSGDNTQDPINFSYTLGGGTATGGGVDYVSTGGTGSIASGGAGTPPSTSRSSAIKPTRQTRRST